MPQPRNAFLPNYPLAGVAQAATTLSLSLTGLSVGPDADA
jgi:hypothetical protein